MFRLRKTFHVTDPNKKNKTTEHQKEFTKACRDGDIETVKWYCSKYKNNSEMMNYKDVVGSTGLIYAAGNGHANIVRLLCSDSRVDVNCITVLSARALSCAISAKKNAFLTTKTLLSCTKDLELDADDKYTYPAAELIIDRFSGKEEKELLTLLAKQKQFKPNSIEQAKSACHARAQSPHTFKAYFKLFQQRSHAREAGTEHKPLLTPNNNNR